MNREVRTLEVRKESPLGNVYELEFTEYVGRNEWRLSVGLDGVKVPTDFWWQELGTRNNAVAYFGKASYYRKQLVHQLNDQTGFGGAEFHLTMWDGSVRTVKGPWSSNPSYFMDEYGVDPYVEVEVNGESVGLLVWVVARLLEDTPFDVYRDDVSYTRYVVKERNNGTGK